MVSDSIAMFRKKMDVIVDDRSDISVFAFAIKIMCMTP